MKFHDMIIYLKFHSLDITSQNNVKQKTIFFGVPIFNLAELVFLKYTGCYKFIKDCREGPF